MVFHSDYPPVAPLDLPIHEAVLGGCATGEHADRPALVDGLTGRSVSYRELDAGSRRLAAGLAAAGVAQGDVVALLCPNSLAYPLAFYGTTRTGATVTPVNPLATAAELAGQLRDSGARWIITAAAFLPLVRQATAEHPPAGVFLCDAPDAPNAPDAPDEGERGAGPRTLAELAASDAPEPAPRLDPAADLAVLPYSSGTTGLPKGVMLTHRSVSTNLAQVDALLGPAPGERVLAVLPFAHIYGLTALLNRPLRARSTVVVLPRFDLEQFLTAIQRHRIEAVYVAPPIALALAKHPLVDRFDLSSIRYVLSAAAPLDAVLAAACARRLGLPHLLQGYGMTELSPVTHVVPPGDPHPPVGTVGRLVPGTELRIRALDAPPRDLGPGEDGELLFRGPQVMNGYFGRESATAATVDPDGWLHTGDVGHVDAAGWLFVVDRVKELIKYKGHQVAPAELEALLLTHPRIADAAVIGVTDAHGAECPKAYVVPAFGCDLAEQEVIEYVARRVAPYKKVREVEFLEAVPKSASGKILRRELRDRAARSAAATTAATAAATTTAATTTVPARTAPVPGTAP
ncbi:MULTISPECIES: AMP-binding protein [Kitasatospora]|uniref:Putative 4-coumarat--CoA ligase n=1 Tax=Kitasatospora setae (strain ATCC 33774 / DSM 43861 / JCM 3304 / KCC A-0304 / NBRC 14216 / KM-6054) TaxID=452652 RepID=E4NJ43_KITSK|nr:MULTISPECIES: AMP-binding protein [Kitasatospora]BAJ32991.1 putative 4-coumarat--CoA ligase [Kitasatospora setae KM-6054]